MQREVLDPDWSQPRTMLVDHRNGDTLDNRRSNLRWVTFSQSNMNRRVRSDSISGYRGVVRRKGCVRWHAYIKVDGRRHYGGYHDTPEQAALAYNELALKFHGEFARLNEVPE